MQLIKILASNAEQKNQIENELFSLKIPPLWISESVHEIEWGILYSDEAIKELKQKGISCEIISYAIDWDSQWASFAKGAPNNGVYEISFRKLGLRTSHTLFLKSGPGFGDLSHPTTRLMLKFMESICKGRDCIDIGSGSGILTIAALKLGAQLVEACDIDEQAILHTKENILLNHFQDKASVNLPEDMWKNITKHTLKHPVILINMIESEQKQAMPWVFSKNLASYTLISSGILKKEKKEYCRWIESFGPRLIGSKQSGEWAACAFEYIYRNEFKS